MRRYVWRGRVGQWPTNAVKIIILLGVARYAIGYGFDVVVNRCCMSRVARRHHIREGRSID